MWRLWQNNCLQRQQHMWSSDLCVVTEKRRGKHHSAFCLSGNCLWLMISHKGLLGGSAAVFVGYMYEVRGVFGCTCAFKKKRRESFAWDWCTPHCSTSRSNTMWLLKSCLSPLCVHYNGTLLLGVRHRSLTTVLCGCFAAVSKCGTEISGVKI